MAIALSQFAYDVGPRQVRLRPYVEMRGADAGPLSHVLALPAFWVGLLYDRQAKAAALELIRDWTPSEMLALRREVGRRPPRDSRRQLD